MWEVSDKKWNLFSTFEKSKLKIPSFFKTIDKNKSIEQIGIYNMRN